MKPSPWMIAGLVCLTLALVCLLGWPAAADTKSDAKPGGRLEQIDKKLERIESALGDIQKELKALKVQQTGWQKVIDTAHFTIMMETQSGKVMKISKIDGSTTMMKQ